jgi:branched-chain amino acid transport system permease protein
MTKRNVIMLALGLLAVLAIGLPWLTQRQDWLNLGFLICLNICLGQSWNILGGFTGQHSLGHAAFFGIGALITRTAWIAGIPIIVALLLGGVAATLCAMVIGVPTFRLRGAYFSIGTLAMSEVIHTVVSLALPLITTLSIEQIASYNLSSRYYMALGLTVIVVGSTWLILRMPVSLGMLAVREDQEAARASGVNPLKHKLLALAISTFFAGMTGGLFAYHQVSYYPQAAFSPSWTFDAMLISFVGGVGTIAGPVIGALFFVALRELLSITFVSLNLIVFGTLFITVVLVFPGGLIEIWHKLRRRKPHV